MWRRRIGSKEVLAVEDMMREHGVLRRALLVYAEAAARLRSGQRPLPADALGRCEAHMNRQSYKPGMGGAGAGR